MKLLTNDEYKMIENYLYEYNPLALYNDIKIKNSIEEVKEFFEDRPHKYFLEKYYLERKDYVNRYPSNSSFLKKICKDLYIEEPTGYRVKQELIYKTAMIFYKNGVIK